ncbi:SDR family NAD(P)-dependent oxidoreductase [Pseudalkalibacillus hwajinpoensis]|uniref:SDR family NAD(P)-dependent oxidoreductase n=1 Tax=Guptibacillus hwajinpoensis TaxID=208199 RepID=UPI00325AD713
MNILLTGATGFVGKQLTIRLLREGHTVYALVRNERKADNLIKSLPTELQSNLFIMEGNITKDQVGVSRETLGVLKDTIDSVYHIAAYLSFDDSEKESTFHINVNGTRNILELAKAIKTKKFYHVSTAYTLGHQLYASEKLHPINNRFVNYYEESKCHAEHLVFDYKDYFHVSIFRPSIIVGDSKTGEAETTFALYGVIRSFEIMKKRMQRKKETLDGKIKFLCAQHTAQNLVPVDYVINVLMAALEHSRSDKIYHITNSNPPTNQMVFEFLKAGLDFDQVELVPTNYDGELTEQEMKFNEPMKVFRKYLEKTLTFDDSNTKQLLQESNLEPLDMNEDVLRTIISAGR